MTVLNKVVDLLDDLVYNKNCSEGLDAKDIPVLLEDPDEFHAVNLKLYDYYHIVQDSDLDDFLKERFDWWVDNYCDKVTANLRSFHFRHSQTDLPKQIDLYFRVLRVLLTRTVLPYTIVNLAPSFTDITQTLSLFNQKDREVIFVKLHDKFKHRLHRFKANNRQQDLEEHILLWNNLTQAIDVLSGTYSIR